MANTKISDLTAGAAVTATDVFPNVQSTGSGPVKTTAAQLKTFMSASPALVTPALGVATATSLAVGGATLGSDALAVTGGIQGSSTIYGGGTGAGKYGFTGDSTGMYATAGNAVAQAFVGGNTGGIKGLAGTYFGWVASTTAVYGQVIDTSFFREAAGVVGVRGTGATSPGTMSFYTYGASPPAAPAASIARLYADTSGGKIRIMALFPTGVAQQVAIEP